MKRGNSGQFFPRKGLYRNLDPFTHRRHYIYYVPRHSKALHSAHAVYSSASCYSHIQQLWQLQFPRLRHKGVWGTRGSERYSFLTLTLEVGGKFTFHSQLNRSLCVLQSRSGRLRGGNSLTPPGNRKIPSVFQS